ncbi:hypothetical protein PVOR_26438 [Paenibacillus vortex V453]|uniref:Uncharacterized protein n=1 Tax=Paenibacillus vortex V453 TaxID=715225 RepID=A0A2R9SP27_9BACL|nr:hypothetical protein [Paenibacillus vortex]EFU39140.1 hypothetical protein PVOR_26438 [Paenibacillus vortex V453]
MIDDSDNQTLLKPLGRTPVSRISLISSRVNICEIHRLVWLIQRERSTHFYRSMDDMESGTPDSDLVLAG